MKVHTVDAYPGVIALFVPECKHLKNTEEIPTASDLSFNRTSYISIAAPFGCNHRNVNIIAIERSSSYKYSLKDLYSKKDFLNLDESKITSITDNLVTPLVVVPFSIIKKEDVSNTQRSHMLLDVVNNVPLTEYQAVAPKIKVELNTTVTLRSSIKGRETSGAIQTAGTGTMSLLCMMISIHRKLHFDMMSKNNFYVSPFSSFHH